MFRNTHRYPCFPVGDSEFLAFALWHGVSVPLFAVWPRSPEHLTQYPDRFGTETLIRSGFRRVEKHQLRPTAKTQCRGLTKFPSPTPSSLRHPSKITHTTLSYSGINQEHLALVPWDLGPYGCLVCSSFCVHIGYRAADLS